VRTQLETALRTRNDTGIELARRKIHGACIEYAQIIRDLRTTAPEESRLLRILDRGRDLMTRAALVNANLSQAGTEITRADDLVTLGKTQIRGAQNRSLSGNATAARKSLQGFRNTLESLRDTYRRILVNEDLPQGLSDSVLAAARSADSTAAQIAML
jgi:hypothetical protein